MALKTDGAEKFDREVRPLKRHLCDDSCSACLESLQCGRHIVTYSKIQIDVFGFLWRRSTATADETRPAGSVAAYVDYTASL